MEKYFGVDVGGTNIKIGVVSKKGKIIDKIKYSTTKDRPDEMTFINHFIEVMGNEIKRYPEIDKIGIGLPGTLSNDRKKIIEIPNIPNIGGTKFFKELENAFPDKKFKLENDANAAALGEYNFGSDHMPKTFLFITLGTGVGSGLILNKKIFTGGKGNAMELGHIISDDGKVLEAHIGKKGIMKMTLNLLKEHPESEINELKSFRPKDVALAGLEDDIVGKKVFSRIGNLLGKALVTSLRLFDINDIYVGGGLATGLKLIKPEIMNVLNKYLPEYYTEDLKIKKASLGNDAGILGAASLFIDD
ncbi:ROK family protein [Marinigracilibium pacificum]|uniref:ROK family protein n=1 Tax=Marinigracilibium pacificum TaxID=2729599 RepID=A0A848J2W4_9BACT|nr:ROK family protein [Marinigracilibium pacificum]NMM50106.1 ROK family protein [Marinigracilibium pacificum]